MAPKSFYKQVLPPNSADVGFSLMSVHYVNTLPPLRAGEAALDASRQQTKRDIWEKDFCSFLGLPASELVPGSSLVLSFLSDPPEGETNFEVDDESLRWAQQFELPTHYPSPEKVREKVTSVGDWEIKDLIQQEIKHPAVQELKERRAKRDDVKDLEWYANTVIDWFMAVISGYFLKTLSITQERNWTKSNGSGPSKIGKPEARRGFWLSTKTPKSVRGWFLFVSKGVDTRWQATPFMCGL
ncbi:S-adenosyl-L-methionine-dependent methyltransferase [Phyllosticta citrichinensis]|uniref:S-adenosyl-L-methionine-dependent methyltransferase n=1 Tax=Phyllosticta citrichinensis TaxID=1130410 RepID=A0ABR1XKI6_9PEZI